MTVPEPAHVPDADLNDVFGASKRAIWSIVGIEGVIIIILMITVSILGAQRLSEPARTQSAINTAVASIDASVASQCGFYMPLIVSGNELSPKTASKLGVQLVEGSRRAWTGLNCGKADGGTMPPPSPVLVQLGRKYGVPIRY